MSALIFREQDNGQSARVSLGATIEVALKENPTTGYKWSRPLFEERLLALESDEFVREKQAGVGGGGIRRFVFSAREKGATSIHLKHQRPWQNEEQAVATFELRVEIAE